MRWTNIRQLLSENIQDVTLSTAYRAASRSIPCLAVGVQLTNYNKTLATRDLLNTIRGFVVLSANLRSVDHGLLLSARRAILRLSDQSNAKDSVQRSIRSALECACTTGRQDRIEYVRRSLQASRNIFENARQLMARESIYNGGYVDVWETSYDEIQNSLNKNMVEEVSIFHSKYELTYLWNNFEKYMIFFDESWSIWLTYLRYRLLGIASIDIPSSIWYDFERIISLKDDGFWTRSEIEISIDVGELIEQLKIVALDKAATRDQNGLGIRFTIDHNQNIDIDFESNIKNSVISYKSVAIDKSNELSKLCEANSTAVIQDINLKYAEELHKDPIDGPLVVFRGLDLIKHFERQQSRDLESDMPPLQDSVLAALEGLVGAHNMILSLNPHLQDLHRSMMGLEPDISPFSGRHLRELVRASKERLAFTERATEALSSLADLDTYGAKDAPAVKVSITASILNVITVVSDYVWEHRRKVAAGIIGVPAAVYAVGSWMIANEAIIRGYFHTGSDVAVLVANIFQILHKFPLL